jgi:TonB family protein
MYFDFDDSHPDISGIGRAISWREGVLLSIIVHLVAVVVMLAWPRFFPPDLDEIRQREALLAQQLEQAREKEEPPRFVFVQPRVDPKALRPPPRAELSDQDREARTRERAETPTNPLPLSRGNTRERVEQSEPDAARGRGPEPDPAVGLQARAEPEAAPPAPDPAAESPRLPEAPSRLQLPPPRPLSGGRLAGGSLGEALKNLQRYVERDQFENPQGGTSAFGPAIQFDTKGVEFGPWIRRFIAQVKRNWLIPNAAMMLKGHVVITFNVHKSGAITDLAVVQPSNVDAFNNAAFGALASSNPTVPLPPEYPADKAFFTVTFFYNEEPQ